MSTILNLTFAAPIPVGHTVEITEYSDQNVGKKGPSIDSPQTHPSVQDLDTGIRYLNHLHVSTSGNGGNAFRANTYPLAPRADLPVARVYRATVTACSLVLPESEAPMIATDSPGAMAKSTPASAGVSP